MDMVPVASAVADYFAYYENLGVSLLIPETFWSMGTYSVQAQYSQDR
jgi:hypothetical protein